MGILGAVGWGASTMQSFRLELQHERALREDLARREEKAREDLAKKLGKRIDSEAVRIATEQAITLIFSENFKGARQGALKDDMT